MNKGTKILILVNLVLLLLWVGMFYYSQRLARSIEEKSGELRVVQEKEAALADQRRDLRETGDLREKLGSYLVREGEEALFLEHIENMARELSLGMKVFTFEKRDKALYANFATEGAFAANFHMLKFLETLPYNASVNKVLLAKEEGEAGTTWTAKFELSVNGYTSK